MEIKSNLIEAHIVRLIDGKIEFLLLKRSEHEKYPNIWQMVTGKVRKAEEGFKAAIREIKEETNINVSNLFVVPNVNPFYNSDDDSVNLIPVFVTEVNLDTVVKISDEHQDYQWANKKEAKELLAWPGQSESVKIIHSFFSRKQKNLNFIEIDIT